MPIISLPFGEYFYIAIIFSVVFLIAGLSFSLRSIKPISAAYHANRTNFSEAMFHSPAFAVHHHRAEALSNIIGTR